MKIIFRRLWMVSLFLFFFWNPSCWGMDAAQILERVHARYSQGNFEADFVQEAYLQAMDMVDTARGHLQFGPPGMMRWHYQNPEEYFIISDGHTVWVYKPSDKQVMRGRTADYFGKDGETDYFTNAKELTKDFNLELELEGPGEKDHHVLKLTTKTKRQDLTGLDLFISKESSEITQVITRNPFGDRTTIRFSSYRYDQRFDPSLFRFEIPKGVEVLDFQDERK